MQSLTCIKSFVFNCLLCNKSIQFQRHKLPRDKLKIKPQIQTLRPLAACLSIYWQALSVLSNALGVCALRKCAVWMESSVTIFAAKLRASIFTTGEWRSRAAAARIETVSNDENVYKTLIFAASHNSPQVTRTHTRRHTQQHTHTQCQTEGRRTYAAAGKFCASFVVL